MIRSDEIDQLAAALCAAQAEFEGVAKSAANPFFKSSYAPLPEVVKAASPILAGYGLSVTQLLGHDEAGDTLTTCLMHKSGQFIGDSMHMRPVKDDPQAQGSATTYARRYSYMAILGLVADDDDGNAGSQGTRQKPAHVPARASSAAPKTSRGGKKGGAAATAPESRKSDKAEDAAPPEGEPIGSPVLKKLRDQFNNSGWSNDRLILTLIGDCGIHGVNEENVGQAMQSLTLDQAMKLMEAMGGSAADLV